METRATVVQRKSDRPVFAVEAASEPLRAFVEDPRLLACAEVARLIERDPARLRTFTERAGTLLLRNTSAIHRGEPIQNGTRYAVTNYYLQRERAGAAMDARFAPVLRAQRPAPAPRMEVVPADSQPRDARATDRTL